MWVGVTVTALPERTHFPDLRSVAATTFDLLMLSGKREASFGVIKESFVSLNEDLLEPVRDVAPLTFDAVFPLMWIAVTIRTARKR